MIDSNRCWLMPCTNLCVPLYTDRTKFEIVAQSKKIRSSILHQVSANHPGLHMLMKMTQD